MEQATSGEARKLAQDLVEILGCYEEELMAVESEAPQMSRLRRAVGIVIAEAYYLITPQGGPPHAAAEAFRRWVLREMAESGVAPP